MADWILVPLDDGDGCFEGCLGCALVLAVLSLLGGGCAAAGVSILSKKKPKK